MSGLVPVSAAAESNPVAIPVARPYGASPAGALTGAPAKADRQGPLGFADMVDIINPLQQIPIVGDIYRSISGDEISDGARYAGSALYGVALGGPIGMGAFMASTMVSQFAEEQGLFSSKQPSMEQGAMAFEPVLHAEQAASPGIVDLAADLSVDPAAEQAAEHTDAALGVPAEVDGDTLMKWLKSQARGTISASADTDSAVPADLGGMAAHPSNRLPLNVLKVLQERHMGLILDEPT